MIGVEGITKQIESAPRLNKTISNIFGSAEMFARIVRWSWYFAIVAHATEGFYVAYHCVKTLKLKPDSALKWFWIITCVGYPVSSKFLALLNADKAARAIKKTT